MSLMLTYRVHRFLVCVWSYRDTRTETWTARKQNAFGGQSPAKAQKLNFEKPGVTCGRDVLRERQVSTDNYAKKDCSCISRSSSDCATAVTDGPLIRHISCVCCRFVLLWYRLERMMMSWGGDSLTKRTTCHKAALAMQMWTNLSFVKWKTGALAAWSTEMRMSTYQHMTDLGSFHIVAAQHSIMQRRWSVVVDLWYLDRCEQSPYLVDVALACRFVQRRASVRGSLALAVERR